MVINRWIISKRAIKNHLYRISEISMQQFGGAGGLFRAKSTSSVDVL